MVFSAEVKMVNEELKEIAVEVSGVTKRFGEKVALCDISFSINKGEFTVVLGRNGSGKSVLMQIIAGLEEASEGEVQADEAGLVFQNARAQILGDTVEEDLEFSLLEQQLTKAQKEAKIDEALKESSLTDKREESARALSGGEERRLALSNALLLERKLLIFDEPFANLDYPSVKQVCRTLESLKKRALTVIVLTHETEKILALADKVLILDKGKLKFTGTAQEALKEDLQSFGIRPPLVSYESLNDLFWE